MAKVLFMMPTSQPATEDQPLKKEDLRHYPDADLLFVIALTDALMFQRPLTEIEKHNFWLVMDERRERASYQQSK
jgi:hypothetical protein